MPPIADAPAQQVTVLRQRMKTMQTGHKTDTASLRLQMRQQIAYVSAKAAKLKTRLILATAVMLALAVAFLA